jgi:hypothetical protein
VSVRMPVPRKGTERRQKERPGLSTHGLQLAWPATRTFTARVTSASSLASWNTRAKASSTEVTLLPAHLKAEAVVEAPLAAALLAAAQLLVDPALPLGEQFGVGVAPVLVGRTSGMYSPRVAVE